MLEVLDHRSLGELIPLAEIVPVADAFYRRNITFHPDEDDWGKYHIAAFRTDDAQPFAVVQYEHEPKEKAHLFVSEAVPPNSMAIIIEVIAKALGLPPETFHWRDEHGELVSLAPDKAA